MSEPAYERLENLTTIQKPVSVLQTPGQSLFQLSDASSPFPFINPFFFQILSLQPILSSNTLHSIHHPPPSIMPTEEAILVLYSKWPNNKHVFCVQLLKALYFAKDELRNCSVNGSNNKWHINIKTIKFIEDTVARLYSIEPSTKKKKRVVLIKSTPT